MFRLMALALILALGAGCTSIALRNQRFVEDRVQKLKPLSSYESTWCRVDARLTEPAAARYAQMFPEESSSMGGMSFTWKASENRCEITPLQKSKVSENYKAFVEQALCLIMHVHWINSPFDELAIDPQNIEGSKDFVRLRTGSSPDLGVFLNRTDFVVETKTKSRGTFTATYASNGGTWRPAKIEHHSGANTFVIDQISYEAPSVISRDNLTGFWISIGNEKPLAHSEVSISECRRQ